MESIRVWAIGLCSAAIGCTVLQLLAPKKGLGKLFSIMVALFFVYCLVSPLPAWGEAGLLWPDGATQGQEFSEEALRRQTEKTVTQAVYGVAKGVLNSHGYNLEKVEIQTDISEGGYIYMTGITVWVDKENAAHSTAIATLLRQRLEVMVTVKSM